jgi:hypothetical protein
MRAIPGVTDCRLRLAASAHRQRARCPRSPTTRPPRATGKAKRRMAVRVPGLFPRDGHRLLRDDSSIGSTRRSSSRLAGATRQFQQRRIVSSTTRWREARGRERTRSANGCSRADRNAEQLRRGRRRRRAHPRARYFARRAAADLLAAGPGRRFGAVIRRSVDPSSIAHQWTW